MFPEIIPCETWLKILGGSKLSWEFEDGNTWLLSRWESEALVSRATILLTGAGSVPLNYVPAKKERQR